jgi:hypothetical protein
LQLAEPVTEPGSARTFVPALLKNRAGHPMDYKQQMIEEYLGSARKAEDQANKFPRALLHEEGWLRIAYAYRDMARANGYKG